MPTLYRAIYRRHKAKGADPGVYYRKLPPSRQKKLKAKWKQLLKEGKLKTNEDWMLSLLRENKDWEIWRQITRIKLQDKTIKERGEYTLCFGKEFRTRRTKPRPIRKAKHG